MSEADLNETVDERRFSILVVDDNPVTRVLCSRVLARDGYRVLLAEDGIEALKLVKENPIDLVLLDLMMPGLSGYDVLETLRKLYSSSEMRILMLTAKDQSEDVVAAFERGADDYITKPLDVPVMLARVQAQLRSRTAGRSPAQALMEFAPGTVLEEKYRLESAIGKGSFGTVYRATHLGLDRPVALKIFMTGLRAGGDASFKREAISACRIDHPNAVKVLDLSVADSGTPFMVMELLEGYSLGEELHRHGPLSAARCFELLAPICAVLSEAHRQGIIHRDIKPQNIFLHQSRQGEIVKVLDFGIAKLIDSAAMQEKLTVDGIVGTPVYMAPERFSGEATDAGSDVYSLGVMLFEMLAGRRPFEAEGDLSQLIMQHLNEPPRSLAEVRPELPQGIEAVIARALAKDSADRPSAADLAQRFQAALQHEEPIVLG
ncbi:MAG: protein kinase [Acidobacteriota bacterium]